MFQYQFQSDLSTFELWLLPYYCELFNYPWMKYVKLIIGVGDQNLLTSTKCDVYNKYEMFLGYVLWYDLNSASKG